MKAKNLKSHVQGAWAMVLKTMAPKYCVLKKTLASNKNAQLYLPGVEAEYSAALTMSNEEIRKRKWSDETRKKLLSDGNSALITSISSEEELDCVCKNGIYEENILQALSVYTPTKKYVAEWMNRTHSALISRAVERVPTIFRKLTISEFIGKNVNFWKPAIKLAETDKTGEWAKKLIEYIVQGGTIPVEYSLSGLIHFAISYGQPINLKEIKDFDHNAYCKAVQTIGSEGDKKLYCLQFFPLFSQLKHMAKYFANIEKMGYHIGDANAESYVWLKIAYDNMDKKPVYAKFLDSLDVLKAVVQPKLYNAIIQKMISVCPSSSAAEKLLKKEPSLPKQALFARIYALNNVSDLLEFFPYAGWNKDLAQKVIVALINEKLLPVYRLDELSQNLQEFAKDELETFAQLSAIKNPSLCEDVVKIKLHPKAESIFLTAYFDSTYAKKYVESHKMEESSFKAMVHRPEILNFSGILEVIGLHAKKWGLSESEYLWLLQSPFAGYAVKVKEFVK